MRPSSRLDLTRLLSVSRSWVFCGSGLGPLWMRTPHTNTVQRLQGQPDKTDNTHPAAGALDCFPLRVQVCHDAHSHILRLKRHPVRRSTVRGKRGGREGGREREQSARGDSPVAVLQPPGRAVQDVGVVQQGCALQTGREKPQVSRRGMGVAPRRRSAPPKPGLRWCRQSQRERRAPPGCPRRPPLPGAGVAGEMVGREGAAG